MVEETVWRGGTGGGGAGREWRARGRGTEAAGRRKTAARSSVAVKSTLHD